MLEEIKFVYLKSHPLFSNLCEGKICEVRAFAKIRIVKKGDILDFVETDQSRVYLLIKESVKIRIYDRKGNEFIDILSATDIFGDLSLEGATSFDQHAEVISDNTVVCSFRVVDFKRILEDNPLMFLEYVNMVNAKLKKMESRYSDLVYLDAKERLVRFIKNWATTNGRRQGDKIVMHSYLTHSEIAAVISTSRQCVNVLLNELRDIGMIRYDRKCFELSASFM